MLEIKMIVYDGGESTQYTKVGILISKRFIIEVVDKSKIKVGV